MELEKISAVLKQQKRVCIITHTNPDGDALGSSFALCFLLQKLGIDAQVVLEKPMPKDFHFTGWQPLIYEESMHEHCVVGLDVSDTERFGDCRPLFLAADTQVIIDHHLNGKQECELLYSDSGAAATGEIIFRLLSLFGLAADTGIATALYIAVMTDTGGCKFGNTTRTTHLILAELIGLVNNGYVNRMVFDVMPMEKVKLQGRLLSEMEFYKDGKIGVITAALGLTKDEYTLNGMVNLALNIEGVYAGVLVKEKGPQEVKLSLRTFGGVNAMEICAAFGGGGHMNAAGCTIHQPLDAAKKMFIAKLEEAL